VLDELGQGHGAALGAVQEADADGLGLLVGVADHHDVGHLGQLGIADLGLHVAAGVVDLGVQAGLPEHLEEGQVRGIADLGEERQERGPQPVGIDHPPP
jgi:hypothetical protein